MKKILWKIGGEAGMGIMTSGLAFSKLASRSGYYVFDYIEYPSLIRGGHNAFEAVFSHDVVHGLKRQVDYLVCLNKQTYELNKTRLEPQACVVFDGGEFQPEEVGTNIDVPFKKILHELNGEGVMKNTIALGASTALLGGDLQTLLTIIETQFGKKGKEVIQFNQTFARAGYEYVTKNHSNKIRPILAKQNNPARQVVLTGNDAFSLGAVIADCRLYASYPMTPSSSVLTTMAAWQDKTGSVVRHAEDEIAVINTAIGSSFAGIRSAVGTSGGGFALMVETVSLAGVTEIPIVIFLSQRPGPATGMPTWTEQGDLLFAVHAGHGEFPKIVLAPGDAEEMVELTMKAFNLADIYQTPVIVITDMSLSESHKTLLEGDLNGLIKRYTIDRGKIVPTPSAPVYLRYKRSDDGISEMLIPGKKGYFYQANSYEHLEDGHTTEDSLPRTEQVDKRNKKMQTYLRDHLESPKVYGDFEKSQVVFVSWGSVKGPVLEAMRLLQEQGTQVSFIHFTHIYPLSSQEITPMFPRDKRYILIENNSHAQFGKLLRQETGIQIEEKLLKYDGRPFWSEEIVEYVKNSLHRDGKD